LQKSFQGIVEVFMLWCHFSNIRQSHLQRNCLNSLSKG